MKIKWWYSESEADQFQQLCEEVLRGTNEAPTLWNGGLAYRNWQRKNRQVVQRLERIVRAEQGIAPVAFEDRLPAADRLGYRGLGAGRARAIGKLKRWQTSTRSAAGWQPNVVDAPAPMIGTPIGRHEATGVDVAFDAISWFEEGIISNPSIFMLGLPGLGKSTFVRKVLMGHVAQGHVPIMAGDIKGEYVGFTEQIGGQVITLGPGKDHINPLDAGALGSVIPIMERHRDQLVTSGKEDLIFEAEEKVHQQQVTMVCSLVELGRDNQVKDYEAMLISLGLRHLRNHGFDWDHVPLVSDLIDVLKTGPAALRESASADNDELWTELTTPLILSLTALMDGATGQVFGGHTSTPIDVDSTAVCMDVSAVDSADSTLKAAVVLAAWGASFGAVEAANFLADAGLREQTYFAITLDEMWQTLGAAKGLVDRVDRLSRLNRSKSTAVYEVTHTFKDLDSLADETDRTKARGFIERAGAVVCGGLPRDELNELQTTVGFTEGEADRITSWSRGAYLKRSRSGGVNAIPAGRGRFMIKASKDGAEGVPVQVVLSPTEVSRKLHDTNSRFADLFDEYEGEDNHVEV